MTGIIALVIPAFRPPPVFPDVVREITSLNNDGIIHAIIVVDDGSEPAYGEVFAAAGRCLRVTVVRREVNGGQGAALKTGIAHALERYPDLAGVGTADADGQHPPPAVVYIAPALAERPEVRL